MRLYASALPFWLLIAGCDGAAKQEARSGSTVNSGRARVTGTSSTASTATAATCPRTGRWETCSLEKRLEQAGFVLRKAEGELPRRSGLSVEPQAYTLGRARLEVFIYPDEVTMSRDIAGLDTTIVAPRGGKNDWEIPPRFIRSGNLIAVFLTWNEQQAERLSLAVTAGPPQR